MSRTMRTGPVPLSLAARGSIHVGGAGLLVLGLGALVLLAGLVTPVPATLDLPALTHVAVAGDLLSLPQWLSGVALFGVALFAVGARRRFLTFVLLATPAA